MLKQLWDDRSRKNQFNGDSYWLYPSSFTTVHIAENKKYLCGAVLLHMMADCFAGASNEMSWELDRWNLVMAIVIVWIATKIYKRNWHNESLMQRRKRQWQQ